MLVHPGAHWAGNAIMRYLQRVSLLSACTPVTDSGCSADKMLCTYAGLGQRGHCLRPVSSHVRGHQVGCTAAQGFCTSCTSLLSCVCVHQSAQRS